MTTGKVGILERKKLWGVHLESLLETTGTWLLLLIGKQLFFDILIDFYVNERNFSQL